MEVLGTQEMLGERLACVHLFHLEWTPSQLRLVMTVNLPLGRCALSSVVTEMGTLFLPRYLKGLEATATGRFIAAQPKPGLHAHPTHRPRKSGP